MLKHMGTPLLVLAATAFIFLTAAFVLFSFYKKARPVFELLFRSPYLARMKEPLGMRQVPCGVGELRGANKAIQWWEGRYRGVKVGLFGPLVWIGEDDLGMKGSYQRDASGVFQYQGGSLGTEEASLRRELSRLSPAVQAVRVYSKALQVQLAFQGGDARVFLDSDLPILDALLADLGRF